MVTIAFTLADTRRQASASATIRPPPSNLPEREPIHVWMGHSPQPHPLGRAPPHRRVRRFSADVEDLYPDILVAVSHASGHWLAVDAGPLR